MDTIDELKKKAETQKAENAAADAGCQLDDDKLEEISGGKIHGTIGMPELEDAYCPLCKKNHHMLIDFVRTWVHPVTKRAYPDVLCYQCGPKHTKFVVFQRANGLIEYYDMDGNRLQ